MKKTWHWLALVLVLVLAGLAIAGYKVDTLGYPLKPGATTDSWTVQTRIELTPAEGPIRVDFRLPAATPGFARVQEDFISPSFGLSVHDGLWERQAAWTVRRARGAQTLYYRGTFYTDGSRANIAPDPEFPERPELEEPFRTAMTAIVEEVRAHSADIVSFATEMLSRINDPSPGAEIQLFLNDPEWQGDRTRIARTLLADARIPTARLNGLMLGETESHASPARWLAVHNGQRWVYLDPSSGQPGLPENFLFWWLGDEPVVDLSGAGLRNIQWSVRRNEADALTLAEQHALTKQTPVAWMSLMNLPIDVQTVYAVLLLVPIGAFLIVLLRNVIGIRSFGTFMPVLIALAFRETGMLGGVILFGVVVAFGLLFRFYLERLRLLLVPRLTAVLIIVVILMVAMSLLSNRLGIEIGLSVGLFPMVILAMVIERMSIVWEERGPGGALLEGGGSMLIAALTYLVMGLETVQYLVFVFPELLLVVLGLTILMGRYTGYRLSELIRFRELAR